MTILGIETLKYAVDNVAEATRFFDDFGLTRAIDDTEASRQYQLADGSRVSLDALDRGGPEHGSVEGAGVHEVIWGVDTAQALEALAQRLDGWLIEDEVIGEVRTIRFRTPFGVAMGARVFARRPVVYAPDPVNAPGCVHRLNTHRKWRERARPKVINHVVFAVPNYIEGYEFMRDFLGFRLSDHQCGFGMYIRADGTNNHHSLLLLNANAPLPGMDGKVRFHHANFGVEDIDEIMVGANYMVRKGWEESHQGLGRHRIDSALFYYLPCPAGGEAEYGADADYVDENWVPREFTEPLFAYAHFVHDLPPFLTEPPAWKFHYLTQGMEIGGKA